MLIYFHSGFLSNDIKDYWYVSQGKLTVPSIDDKEDMQFADEAFDILGFSTQMKYDVFRNTACMMHMGNMTKDFVPVGKEEQAEIKDPANCEKVAELLGIGELDFAFYPYSPFPFFCRLRVDDHLLLQAQAEGRNRVGAEGFHLPGCCQLCCRHCPCHL